MICSIEITLSSEGPYQFEVPGFFWEQRLLRYLADHASVQVLVRFRNRSSKYKTYGEILRDVERAPQIAAEERANAQAKLCAEQRAVEERARKLAEQRAEERMSRREALSREFASLFPSVAAASSEVHAALDNTVRAHAEFAIEYASLQFILSGPHSSLTRSEAQGLLDRLRAIHSNSATMFPKSVTDFLARLEELIREVCDQRDAERAAKHTAWLQEQSQKSRSCDYSRPRCCTTPSWV